MNTMNKHGNIVLHEEAFWKTEEDFMQLFSVKVLVI